MKNPHFIFIFFSFYPENIPYAQIIKEISSYLIDRKCTVEIITLKQNQEQIAAVNEIEQLKQLEFTYIKKIFSSKSLFYIWFPVASFFISVTRKNCYIIAPSTPPVIMPFSIALAKMVGFNRFSFIYHCQDIHPEAMQSAGRVSIFDFFLQKLEKFSLKNADKIITLSEEMKDTLRHKTSNKNIFVVDNYIPHASSHSKKKKSAFSEVKLIYAGNIGIFQNLELLVGILLNEEIPNISLTIIGEGVSKQNISKMISNHKNQNKIKILPSVTSKEIGEIIANHDFGVVSLIPTMSRYANPSKINTYLAERIPIICISDKNTELEKIIHKEKIGAYCYTNDRGNIISTLRHLGQLKNELDEDNIYSYYLKSNSKEKLLASFFKTIIS